MRMRSRLGSGRLRKTVFITLLAIAAVFAMVLGLVLIVVLVCAAAVFMAGLYVWAALHRWRRHGHSPHDGGDDYNDGVTLEGEYTVEEQDSPTGKQKD